MTCKWQEMMDRWAINVWSFMKEQAVPDCCHYSELVQLSVVDSAQLLYVCDHASAVKLPNANKVRQTNREWQQETSGAT
jgi:hypothetical protein